MSLIAYRPINMPFCLKIHYAQAYVKGPLGRPRVTLNTRGITGVGPVYFSHFAKHTAVHITLLDNMSECCKSDNVIRKLI